MEGTSPSKIDESVNKGSTSGIEATPEFDPDLTLAQQIAENERQMYERSQQMMTEIEDEVRKTQPLVSDKQEIISLVAEFDPDDSPQYFKKATELAEVYSHIRRIRGDGNCFYRAVLTALLERCFDHADELNRFNEQVKEWRQRLVKLESFPDLTTGDFCTSMEQLMTSMIDGTMQPQILMDDLNQDGVANYYVAFCRFICSGYLRENEALYSGFVEGSRTIDQFCREEVEPMWKDCDHLCIIALVNAIGVSIRIEYMDRSQAPSGGWRHDFIVDGNEEPKLFFLYRPGHYDILYLSDSTTPTDIA
ncbi:unnamed protein product [Meloidogyne enterolobii]|uniref:Ubiquitin thioesterase n=2 Tax=Meloidogyne enterolobii TaxID=390850 RepID=A0A6V7VTC4_MELEN|nr:unnamed protein product [Meloidogyne enterolobii]